MKLVITTNELSPCRDKANELTAGMTFSDGVSVRTLSLGRGVGHPKHRRMSKQTAPFSPRLGHAPSSSTAQEVGGGPGELWSTSPRDSG